MYTNLYPIYIIRFNISSENNDWLQQFSKKTTFKKNPIEKH